MNLDSYNCVFCVSVAEETCQHLFLQCPFARHCWHSIQVETPIATSFPEAAVQIKDQLRSRFFMATLILMAWSIWTVRNKLIFKGIQPSIEAVKACFQKELLLLMHRVKENLQEEFIQWTQSLGLL